MTESPAKAKRVAIAILFPDDVDSMPIPRLYFLCPDKPAPTGGIRMIYRQVDLLNRNGFPAFVLHQQPGFRIGWFEHNTPVVYPRDVKFSADTLLVLPEVCMPRLFQATAGVPKVIFNQNCYNSFLGWEADEQRIEIPYRLPDVRGAIVVSDDSRDYLQHAFPQLKIFRLHYSINPQLYHAGETKKPQIALMPRKNADDVAQVVNLLKFRGVLGEFQITPIHDLSESAAAAVLRQSLFFLSFGHPEGFGLPAAEAMACACLTVGYHGMGGKEFFRPEFSFPIETGDVLTFARTVESLLNQYRADPTALDEKRRQAAQFIASHYPPEQEERDVVTIWRALLGVG
jgi:hypothetical protein